MKMHWMFTSTCLPAKDRKTFPQLSICVNHLTLIVIYVESLCFITWIFGLSSFSSRMISLVKILWVCQLPSCTKCLNPSLNMCCTLPFVHKGKMLCFSTSLNTTLRYVNFDHQFVFLLSLYDNMFIRKTKFFGHTALILFKRNSNMGCYHDVNHQRKWNWWPEFKSWPRLFSFHFMLMFLGKTWIYLFSFQLWINGRSDRIL